MKRINEKGFTLIELLAVIVILGVVMAIAIPSMNKVIDNSKKDTLIATAQEYISGAKTMLVSENSLPDYVLYPEVEMPLIEIDGEQYIGFLEIPALNLSLPVLGGEWKEERLKKAPGLYEGSVYQDNMIIAGHNYRSHFSGLKKLEEGTEIYFIDGNGTVFSYELAWVEVIDEMDVEQMSAQTEGWDLTLFTCTYGGRERYTLRCVKQMFQ